MKVRKYRVLWIIAAVMTAFSACGQVDISRAAEISGTGADSERITETVRETAPVRAAEIPGTGADSERMTETVRETVPVRTSEKPVPDTEPVTCPCTCANCICRSASTEEDSKYEEEYVTLTSPANEDLLDLANYPNLKWVTLILPLPDDTDITLLNGLEGPESFKLVSNSSMPGFSALSGLRLPGVKNLFVSDSGSFSVDFIPECFPGSEYVNISGNYISDIETLSALKNLKDLWISDCKLDDIDFVKDIPGLQVLYAKDNSIVDISPLAGMTELYMLNISGNPVGDRAGETLKTLHSLTSLSAGSCGITDISFLSGCPELEELYISHNPISDITPVKRA